MSAARTLSEVVNTAMAACAIACEHRVMRMVVVVSLVVAVGCERSEPAPSSAPAPAVMDVPSPKGVSAPKSLPPPVAPVVVAALALTDAEFEAWMAETQAMFDAMGTASDDAGKDCGKLGVRLSQVLDDHARVVATTKRFKGDKAMEARVEAWMKDHMDEVMRPMMKVGAAGNRCSRDPEFTAFMRRFGELY